MANTETDDLWVALEPLAKTAFDYVQGDLKDAALLSIAISLKRIADSRSGVFYVDRGIPGLDPTLTGGG